MGSKRVGLVGYGYWGRNLARVFNALGVLDAIADPRDEARQEAIVAGSKWKGAIPVLADWHDLLALGLDALAIATPPETHYEIAKAALEAGKSVFVEKPLTTSGGQARELYELARRKNLALATGLIYLHCGGVQLMPTPLSPAELSVRLLNPAGGPSPSTQDMLTAGLPHAVSLACQFFRSAPVHIEASCFQHQEIRLRLDYWNGSRAWLEVADYTGLKSRRAELRIGNTAWLFNLDTPERVVVHSGVNSRELAGPKEEPLLTECRAFLEQQGPDPMGVRVTELIDQIKERWEVRVGR